MNLNSEHFYDLDYQYFGNIHERVKCMYPNDKSVILCQQFIIIFILNVIEFKLEIKYSTSIKLLKTKLLWELNNKFNKMLPTIKKKSMHYIGLIF